MKLHLIFLPAAIHIMSFLPTSATDSNEILLKASSPFEDMAEFALAGKDAGIAKSLDQADEIATTIKGALSESASKQFDTLLATIHDSATKKEHQEVAQNAVEVFRLLIDNLNTTSLTVPQEVSLLDYAGFRLHVLIADPKADWEAIGQTISDAEMWWTALKPQVTDKALRDTFNSALRGLKRAGIEKHLAMLDFAAQMDLDLVDLLEHYFERKVIR
jgi:hypothetical protein